MLNIIEAIRAPELLNDELSLAQTTALKALYGLPLSDEESAIYQQATGNAAYFPHEHREGTFICGRRSGKSSKLAANCAIYEACFRPHSFAKGEQPWVIVLAATRRQAQIVFRYVLGRIESSPVLRRMLAGEPRSDARKLLRRDVVTTLGRTLPRSHPLQQQQEYSTREIRHREHN